MLGKKLFRTLVGGLLWLASLTGLASTQGMMTEQHKLINVIGINVHQGFGYVSLFKRDTDGCGPYGLMTMTLATEEERLVFSTLLAAKTASRAVTVSFDPDNGCAITSAHVH